jgi:Ca2+/Na+ antiporter
MIVVDKDEKQSTWSSVFTSIVVIVWVALGIAAFIVSLLCFGKSGTMTHKIFGFLLAVIFGPFYWVYFIVTKRYCKSKLK